MRRNLGLAVCVAIATVAFAFLAAAPAHAAPTPQLTGMLGKPTRTWVTVNGDVLWRCEGWSYPKTGLIERCVVVKPKRPAPAA